MCVCKCFFLIFALLGVATFVLGFILGFTVFETLIEDEIIERVRLKNGTEQFARWRDPQNPNSFSVYLFHIINPEEVTYGQATPVVDERGPYIYRQTRTRDEIRKDEASDRIYYQEVKGFVFDSAASSPLVQSNTVTVLNVPLQTWLQIYEEMDDMPIFNANWREAFNIAVDNNTPLFLTISIQDYLFDGYRFCIGDAAPPLCNVIRQSGSRMLRLEPNAIVFSFFDYMRQATTFSMSAGNDDHETLGEIFSMNDQPTLTAWNFYSCNRIRGTDSTIFAPFIEEDSALKVFYPDICRIFDLEFNGHTEFEEMEGYRFRVSTNTFSQASPDRWCHCINRTANLQGQRTCLPNGFEDMFNCLGSNLLLSFPHLLNANIEVQNTVAGLNPNDTIHQSYVEVQTDLGTPLTTVRRLQYNMFIRPNSDLTDGITPFAMPVLWFDDYMELHTDLVVDIRDNFLHWVYILTIITWVLVAAGAGVALVALLLCFCC